MIIRLLRATTTVLVLLTVAGCDIFYNDDEEYEESVANVEWFKVDTTFNTTVVITLKCGTATPCWRFSRVVEKRDSNQIHLTVYQKQKKYQTCVQVTGFFQQTIDVGVPVRGTYSLKMYQTPSTTLDTTITL